MAENKADKRHRRRRAVGRCLLPARPTIDLPSRLLWQSSMGA